MELRCREEKWGSVKNIFFCVPNATLATCAQLLLLIRKKEEGEKVSFFPPPSPPSSYPHHPLATNSSPLSSSRPVLSHRYNNNWAWMRREGGGEESFNVFIVRFSLSTYIYSGTGRKRKKAIAQSSHLDKGRQWRHESLFLLLLLLLLLPFAFGDRVFILSLFLLLLPRPKGRHTEKETTGPCLTLLLLLLPPPKEMYTQRALCSRSPPSSSPSRAPPLWNVFIFLSPPPLHP